MNKTKTKEPKIGSRQNPERTVPKDCFEKMKDGKVVVGYKEYKPFEPYSKRK